MLEASELQEDRGAYLLSVEPNLNVPMQTRKVRRKTSETTGTTPVTLYF